MVLSMLVTYGDRIQKFDDLARLISITSSDIKAAMKKLEIKIRYKGPRKQTVEFDMARVRLIYEEHGEKMTRRRVVVPELLIWDGTGEEL
jgi:hypothetical protein